MDDSTWYIAEGGTQGTHRHGNTQAQLANGRKYKGWDHHTDSGAQTVAEMITVKEALNIVDPLFCTQTSICFWKHKDTRIWQSSKEAKCSAEFSSATFFKFF